MATIRLNINGRDVEAEGIRPTTTLLEYLRNGAGLVGTKEGCAEGDCGACTVALLDEDARGGPAWRAVNSCLMPVASLAGRTLVTAEGLSVGGTPHRVQDALTRALGSQCGYCTPGIIMSMFEACYRDDIDDGWRLDDQMCGNLCRCTGYRPIREATIAIAGARPEDSFRAQLDAAVRDVDPVSFDDPAGRFERPSTFDELFAVLAVHPDARLIAGATDLGLDITKKHATWACLVSLEGLRPLRDISRDGSMWRIGAGVALSDLETWADAECVPLARMLRFFGSRQIKNRATLGGNLCNASPIGDTAPVLLALGATIVLRSAAGERRVAIDDFFLGYRKTALLPGEILAAVELPDLPSDARAAAYKVSKRREMDISAVAAGMMVRVGADGRVEDARLGYGGMAATSARARVAEAALVGSPWSEASVRVAMDALDQDFAPIDDHRGSAWYRRELARNLLLGFFHETSSDPVPRLPERPSGTLVFGEVSR